MSLLEDVFLEDEAGEAQDLERIIEGDGYDDQERNGDDDDDDDGERRDDEAEEDKRRVDPNSTKSKKVVKNPRFVLNPARLTGPRGIHVIPEHFKNFKFKGKGHEKEDLNMVLKKLEHWAYRLYPKFKFEDCLKKMEMLGKKRTVMVHLHKIRSDQYSTEETIVQKDSSDDEGPAMEPAALEVEDEFDKLLQQQIALAHTPAGKRLQVSAGDIGTPMAMPKATSSPSISEEQKQRMLQNRDMAERRRLAKLKQVRGASGMECLVEHESVDLTENDKTVSKNDNKEVTHNNKSTDNGIVEIHHSNNIPEGTRIDLTISDDPNGKSGENESESIVDLTEKTVFAVSRKRTYEITDSDDESGKSDGESITDINDTDIPVTKRANIDKSVENKTVFKKNISVALTDTNKRGKKLRKANIIDSSDEECDATAEDISITVDIHRENSQPQKDEISYQENIDLTKDLPKETNEDLLQKQKDNDHVSSNDVTSKAKEYCSEIEKNINAIETSVKKSDSDTNEIYSEKHEIVTRDESIHNNETSEHRSEKQKEIVNIETSFNQNGKDISEIRSEIESNTASNSMLLENQANTHTKEAISIGNIVNEHKEKGNSLNNVTNLEEESLADENTDQENKIDDIMDVDFSEEF